VNWPLATQYFRNMLGQAIVFWFTGLSGVGKTTLAEGLRNALVEEGHKVLIIDGDDVRNRLHQHLGFTRGDILKNNELIVQLCFENKNQYHFILVPVISPYSESRALARLRLMPTFHEIYITADLRVLQARDTKGLYQAARKNEIKNLIGVSPGSPYEEPEAAELVINTGIESTTQSTVRLLKYANHCLGLLSKFKQN